MPPPSGLGMWVAFESSIDPGGKAADMAKGIEACRRAGASWVCLRSGAGAAPDISLSAESIAAFSDAGLGVYLWPFCYAASLEGELAILRKWRALCAPGGRPRVAGVVLNAEFEFIKNATQETARELVRRVRGLGYDFVAHAPPDYAGGRGDGAMAMLDAESDAILPQVYAWEHDDSGHVHHLRNVQALYAKRRISPSKVWPILCTYRPLQRGGRPTRPLQDEPAIVARDVVAGLEEIKGCPAPSLYSIDALAFASRAGVGARVLDELEEYAKPGPREPVQLGDDSSAATTIADEVHRSMDNEAKERSS